MHDLISEYRFNLTPGLWRSQDGVTTYDTISRRWRLATLARALTPLQLEPAIFLHAYELHSFFFSLALALQGEFLRMLRRIAHGDGHMDM